MLIILRIAALPNGGSWCSLHGVAILGGIGFTTSLFIGTLAFDEVHYEAKVRLGVPAAGSLLSAVTGHLLLRSSPRR